VGIRQVQIPLNRNKTEFNSSDAVAGRDGLVSKRRTDECPPEAERWLMENDGWNSMKVRERMIAVTGRGRLGKWSSIAQQDGSEGLVSKRRADECPPAAERWLMENDGWNSMKVRERIIAVTGRGKLGKWSSIAQQAQPEQTDWIQLIRRVAGQYDQQ
jgi:Holliday junction resolvase-like predicted endonuclease